MSKHACCAFRQEQADRRRKLREQAASAKAAEKATNGVKLTGLAALLPKPKAESTASALVGAGQWREVDDCSSYMYV